MGDQKFSGKIETPFVIGAIIELGNCLNLLEPSSVPILKKAYSALKETYENIGKKMPINKGANRALDCAVIQYVHQSNLEEGLPKYDTIRSAFIEGDEVYPKSNFTERLHIEVCVINTQLIKGYFLPQPVEKHNPYLKHKFKALPND